jgi:hypothetical protein
MLTYGILLRQVPEGGVGLVPGTNALTGALPDGWTEGLLHIESAGGRDVAHKYQQLRTRQGMSYDALVEEAVKVGQVTEDRNKWMADGPVLLTNTTNYQHSRSKVKELESDTGRTRLSETGELSFALSVSVSDMRGGLQGSRAKSAATKSLSFRKAGATVGDKNQQQKQYRESEGGWEAREGAWDASAPLPTGSHGKSKAEKLKLLQQHEELAYARARGLGGGSTSDLWAVEVANDKKHLQMQREREGLTRGGGTLPGPLTLLPSFFLYFFF